ncbi:MAG: RIP metalloprotease RseP [Myxococcota bacterium]
MIDLVTMGVGAVGAIFVLVVVHEFGHFLAAKFFGVGVPTFSVGMGPRLFGIRFKGTDYRISAVPVGGYCRMSGADPFGEEDFDGVSVPPEEDFMQKPVWQRLIIMLAGPFANLVLPVVLFASLYMIGVPEAKLLVGQVSHDSAAWNAGLRVGDLITEVDGEAMPATGPFIDALHERVGTALTLTIERDGQSSQIDLPAGAYDLETPSVIDLSSMGMSFLRTSTRFGIDDPKSPAAIAGLRTYDGVLAVDGTDVETWQEMEAALTPGVAHTIRYVRGDQETGDRIDGEVELAPDASWTPRNADPLTNAFGLVPAEVFIGSVIEDMPAIRAGLQPEDRLYAINGTPVHDFSHLVALVGESVVPVDGGGEPETRSLTVEIVRDGALQALSMKPEATDSPSVYGTRWRPLIGVKAPPQVALAPPRITVQYDPISATILGFDRTKKAIVDTLTALDSLVRVRLDPRDAVGGPVAIFSVTGRSLMMGFHAFAGTIAVISVSLAIVNLLPVPALDGGQIVVFLFEWIRGRPLSAEVRMRIQMVGVVVLFTLIILVTANDIGRLIFPSI